MSAYVSYVDDQTGTLWIVHDGRGDELAITLNHYGVDYITAWKHGHIGIPFRRGLGKDGKAFKQAACHLIDILTARRGLSPQEERSLYSDLVIIQTAQQRNESEQERNLREFIGEKNREHFFGGAAI